MHTKHRPMTSSDMRRNVERNSIQAHAKLLNSELRRSAARASTTRNMIKVGLNGYPDQQTAFTFSTPSDARRALRLARKLIEMERGEQAPVFVPDADNDWED